MYQAGGVSDLFPVCHMTIYKKENDANISNETYISNNSTFKVYTMQTLLYTVIRKS
jgi:hypothetical protein